MIDSNGYLRCDSCNTILARNLIGRIEIICYRSKCHRNNVFDTDKSRHYSLQREIISKQKLVGLTINEKG